MAAKGMFSTALPEKVEQTPEQLQNHSIMIYQK